MAGSGEQHEIEEITVTAPRLQRFQIPDVEFLVESYGDRRKGAELYNEGRYKEAFPYLLASAEQGFKLAQARLGYLYLAGLGIRRDAETGYIWLGLAARGNTTPEIRNYLRSIRDQLPADDRAYLEERIDEFAKRHGSEVNRVACRYERVTSSRIKKLYCRYMDQCRFWRSDAIRELSDCPQRHDPCKNPEAPGCCGLGCRDRCIKGLGNCLEDVL